jgi:hypothetical protein
MECRVLNTHPQCPCPVGRDIDPMNGFRKEELLNKGFVGPATMCNMNID